MTSQRPSHIDIPDSSDPAPAEVRQGNAPGRHSPPNLDPDFKPRGILKNAQSSSYSTPLPQEGDIGSGSAIERQQGDHLTWDEQNINLNEINKDSKMKIDEPKTPFVSSDQTFPDLEVPDFELSSPMSERRASMGSQASPGARRRSEQELVAQNTQRNAGTRRTPGFPFSETVDSTDGTPIVEHAINATTNNPNGHNVPVKPHSPVLKTPDSPMTPGRPGRTSSTPTSRSASFSLPEEKSGSGRLRRSIVPPGNTPGQEMGEEVEEEEGDEAEDKEFKKKRAGHYGGEAEAMKLAQALMAQEKMDEEDDE